MNDNKDSKSKLPEKFSSNDKSLIKLNDEQLSLQKIDSLPKKEEPYLFPINNQDK